MPVLDNPSPDVLRLCEVATALAHDVPGLQLLVLFGSVASGCARRDSDVDVALLGGDSWQGLLLGAALGRVIRRDPHVVDLASAPTALKYEVARTGVLLYEAEPFLWARFQAQAALLYFDLRPLRERCAEGVRRRLRLEAGLE